MEPSGETPHFWPQPTSSPRRRSSSPSPILSIPILIIIFPLLLLIILFFLLPPFLSLISQILKPQSVKRSWDTFNILLVLFAILCGVFGRRNDDGATAPDDGPVRSVSKRDDERPVVPQRWFDEYSSDRKIYDSPIRASGVSRLRRSSSSYPDLRQESLWEVQPRDDRLRFYDDFEINKYNSPTPGHGSLRRTRTDIGDYSDEKVIPVDTFVNRPSHPSPSPPPPPPPPATAKFQSTPPPTPPPPPPVVRRKTRRIHRSVAVQENPETTNKIEGVRRENLIPATTPPPPPPPPPVHKVPKQGKFERSKSMAKKEIAMVWASLGKRSKKKRKAKNVYPFDSSPEEPHLSTTVAPSSPAPPPPPPPPPPSVFHSLFKKGTSKSRKIHSVPAPPPPPPPSKQRTRTQNQIPRPPPTPPKSTSGRPPLPTKTNCEMRQSVPPQMADVRRQSSPEAEDGDYAASCGREAIGSVFCPSPDVNVKADSFIARLRDEWRLEKINSLREKKKNMGLGPGPGPETSIQC